MAKKLKIKLPLLNGMQAAPSINLNDNKVNRQNVKDQPEGAKKIVNSSSTKNL